MMELDLYESLDAIVVDDDQQLANILMDLMGVEIVPKSHRHAEHHAINPDHAAAARHTAFRWLRDHGYIPR